MKVLIDIPEKSYKQIKFLMEQGLGTVIDERITNGVPIPDNAKNIDVLMTVFSKADIRFEGRNNELFGYIEFAGNWLDAPYKGGRVNETVQNMA